MAISDCPECGKPKSDTATNCPHCGYRKPKSATWLWVIISIPIIVLVFGYQHASTPDGEERSRQRLAIDLCHEEMRKNPGNSIATGACQMMEERFKQRFGFAP